MKISPERISPVFTIYIGINDKDTYTQLIDNDLFTGIITGVCRGYRVAYSTHLVMDGYQHADGKYIHETSAALTLIGATREDVNSIAADLCCFFNQESVLVEVRNSTFYDVSEDIKLTN